MKSNSMKIKEIILILILISNIFVNCRRRIKRFKKENPIWDRTDFRNFHQELLPLIQQQFNTKISYAEFEQKFLNLRNKYNTRKFLAKMDQKVFDDFVLADTLLNNKSEWIRFNLSKKNLLELVSKDVETSLILKTNSYKDIFERSIFNFDNDLMKFEFNRFKSDFLIIFERNFGHYFNQRLRKINESFYDINMSLDNFKIIVEQFLEDFYSEDDSIKKVPNESFKDIVLSVNLFKEVIYGQKELEIKYKSFEFDKKILLENLINKNLSLKEIKQNLKIIEQKYKDMSENLNPHDDKDKIKNYLDFVNSELFIENTYKEVEKCYSLSIKFMVEANDFQNLTQDVNFNEIQSYEIKLNNLKKHENFWENCQIPETKHKIKDNYELTVRLAEENFKKITEIILQKKLEERKKISFSIENDEENSLLMKTIKTQNEFDSFYDSEVSYDQKLENLKKFETENIQKILESELSQTIMATLPPKFCWKKFEWGYIPKNCPEGYTREGALCFQTCNEAAKLRNYVCNEEGGFKMFAYAFCHCGSSLTNWFFINYFSNEVLTNFNENITCNDSTHWHHGALCYTKNCEVFMPGFVNCGIGACASSSSSCIWEIVKIFWKTLVGIANFSIFIITFGASSPASVALKKTVAKIGSAHITKTHVVGAVKTVINAAVGYGIGKMQAKGPESEYVDQISKGKEWVSHIYNDLNKRRYAIDRATKLIMRRYSFSDKFRNKENFVKDIVEKRLKHEADKEYSSFEGFFRSFTTSVSKCSNSGLSLDEDSLTVKNVECVKILAETASTVDPTGLVGIAAAFIYPPCPDQETYKPKMLK